MKSTTHCAHPKHALHAPSPIHGVSVSEPLPNKLNMCLSVCHGQARYISFKC